VALFTVTEIVTAPAAWADGVAMIVVPFVTETFVADVAPNVTVAGLAKPVPVIVTLGRPPPVGPVVALTLLTVGI
jgi:hypothetical protein